MSPPDTNLKKQEHRHRGPLLGIALAVVFAIGVILYWIADEAVVAPGPETGDEDITPPDIREGDVELHGDAPTYTVDPSDPDVEVVQ
ncbi:hypothetical protein [Sedimentitalea sp.]|uniref:hypothetical protein n=1 Tax=Sedimentitalea sp. TaxID=2048915 RepID=UPI00329A7F6F